MAHKTSVEYATNTLTSGDLEGWQAQVLDDGSVAVSGPCPVCGGQAFGPELPEIDQIKNPGILYADQRPPRPSRDILARCDCGYSHKGAPDGTASCGRRWVVVVAMPRDHQ